MNLLPNRKIFNLCRKILYLNMRTKNRVPERILHRFKLTLPVAYVIMYTTYKECVRDKPYDRRQPTERQGANA